jgi:hypothetical protein
MNVSFSTRLILSEASLRCFPACDNADTSRRKHSLSFVIAGLDPAIHRLWKDGCPGQARA